MTAEEFQAMRAPAFIPSDAAFPFQQYPEYLVAGLAPPILPHQAAVLYNAPPLQDLPPVSSLYRRPYTVLTQG